MSKTNKIDIDWRPSRTEFIIVIISIISVIFVLSFAIIAYTPARNLIPGYPTGDDARIQMQNALRIDSLERSVYRWELYSENLRRILEGKDPIQIDSIIRQFGTPAQEENPSQFASTDSTLRNMVRQREKFEVSDHNKRELQIEGLHFFKPINGTLSGKYEVLTHPYTEITAPSGSTVKSVLDGSVIYTQWSESDLWCIVVQHRGGIISIYKHNSKLLKGIADAVSAGESIALLGEGGLGSSKGSFLHFELWQNGVPMNPEQYINF